MFKIFDKTLIVDYQIHIKSQKVIQRSPVSVGSVSPNTPPKLISGDCQEERRNHILSLEVNQGSSRIIECDSYVFCINKHVNDDKTLLLSEPCT